MNIYQTPILLKGFHPDHNPGRDYKTAKAPIPTSSGFTKPEYKPPTTDQQQAWTARDGWIGHLVPKGMHVLDIETPSTIFVVRSMLQSLELTVPINHTNNGLQFIFKTNGGPPLPGASTRVCRLGFSVTDRAAGKNYVILPPTNSRTFENEDKLIDPPIIPDEFLPAQNTIEDTTRAIAWALGEAHRQGVLAGYNDLDAGLMALLVSCEISEDLIIESFYLVFLEAFDERRTLAMYQRTKDRQASGEALHGVGSLVQSLKDKGLDSIVVTITKLERLSGKSESSVKSEWIEPIPFDDFSLVPDFPVAALPVGIGREMIEAVSAVNQIDPAFTVSFYLATLSLAAAGKFEIDLGTHRETPNLYFAPSLPSGERKSATVEGMTRPVYDFEMSVRDHARGAVAADCNKRKIAEGRIAEIQKKSAKEINPIKSRQLEEDARELIHQLSETPVPVLPTLVADDITPEKLGDLMCENGEKMAILSSEGGIFDILAGRYDPNGSGNLDLYLKGYSGDPWRSHRIGRESKSMNRPLLTVCLGIQPIVVEEILRNNKFRGRGLLARFLFSHGKAQAGYRDRLTNGIPDDLRKSYSDHIRRILSAEFPKDASISFTEEGQSLWNEFYVDCEQEMRPEGKLYPLKDFGSKLPGSVARIAGLLHFAEFGQDAIDYRVSVSIVSASCVFGIFFLEHAAAIFGAAGEDQRIKVAKQIMDSIVRHRWLSFKGRDILRNTSIGNMDEASTGLKILIERGFIRAGSPTEKGQGRPEAASYDVNPKLKL
jgi:replicative DNA helicase